MKKIFDKKISWWAVAGIVLVFLRFGNGYYLVGDSLGYFAHLPALVIERQLNFGPFFKSSHMPDFVVTENGLTSNIYDCGTAVFWLPFFLIGLLALNLFHLSLDPLCSYPMVYFTNAGTFFGGVLTVFLAARVLEYLDLKKYCLNIILPAVFGTSFFFYITYGASMSHGLSAFVISLFIFLCLRPATERTPEWTWLLLGLTAGLMVITRTNNILYLLLLVHPLEQIPALRKTLALKFLVFFLMGFTIAASPQILIWKTLFGHALAMPRLSAINFNRFDFLEVFFSPFHGLLFWNPLVLVSMLGYLFSWWSPYRKPILLLAACFFLQVLICTLLEVWWMGYSFGNRYLTDSFLPIIIGLCVPFSLFRSKPLIRILTVFYSVLAVWTMGLFVNYDVGRLDLGAIVTGSEIVALQLRLFRFPLEFLVPLIKCPPIFWDGFFTLVLLGGTGVLLSIWIVRKKGIPKLHFLTFLILLNSFIFLFLTGHAAMNTRLPVMAEADKKSMIFTQDWLRYNFFLYRLTEVQYLIKTGRLDSALTLNNQNIQRFYGTKTWEIWEMKNHRKFLPNDVFALLLKSSERK